MDYWIIPRRREVADYNYERQPKMLKRSISATVAAVLACASLQAWAADADKPHIRFSLEPQPLREALIKWSEQAGMSFVLPSGYAAALRMAPRVEGTYQAEEALQRLVVGSGLRVDVIDSNTYALKPANAARVERVAMTSDARDDGRITAAEDRTQSGTARTSNIAKASSGRRTTSDGDSSAAAAETLSEVVVTGSHIRGAAPPATLIQIDRTDVQRSGVSSVQELIDRLPQNFGGGLSEDTGASFVPGSDEGNNLGFGSGVNLRGLGSDSTLVLLNGRRLSGTGAGNFVDISQVPLAAIERIDVLLDGASAVYGSDAVGGVVNLILREDYDGSETRVRYGSVTDGSHDRIQASQTVGHVWSRGHIMGSYDYLDQSRLAGTDRTFSRPPVGDLLPKQTRHSVLLSGGLDLTANAEFSMDALFSSRRSHFLGGTPGVAAAFRNDDSKTESLALGGELAIRLPDSWRLIFSGSASQQDVEYVGDFPSFGFSQSETFENRAWHLESRLSGDIIDLPGGALRAVVGIAYRDEAYKDATNEDPPRVDASRDVVSAFAELHIPILSQTNDVPGVRELDFDAAVRYDRYSDVGSTLNPKFGVSWRPVQQLRARATFSQSFRIPNFAETSSYNDTSFLLDFPNPDFTSTAVALYMGGNNSGIKPEKSKNWTVGLDYESDRVGGLNISLGYFNIAYRDRIATPSSAVYDFLANRAIYAPLIVENPTPAQIAAAVAYGTFSDLTNGAASPADAQFILDNRTTNISTTRVRGLDVIGSYDVQSSSGSWNVSVNVTRLLEFSNAITPVAPQMSILDTVYNPLKWRVRPSLVWSEGAWTTALSANYTGSYTNTAVSPNARIDSWTTADFSIAFEVGAIAGSRWAADSAITLSALNVFDRDPPFVTGPEAVVLPTGYDPTNASPLGRFVSLELRKSF